MKNKSILLIMGGIFLVGLLGVIFFTLNGEQQVNVTYQENALYQIPTKALSNAIVFNNVTHNVTLFDSTTFNATTNVCKAQRYGMETTIYPCVAQDVNGEEIQQYVDFKWNGAQPQNTSWVFVYEGGGIASGDMRAWKNISYQKTIPGFQWISNFVINNVVSYVDLGAPTGFCDLGSLNNTQRFNVTRYNPQNQTNYNQVICFTNVTPINASSFSISGNIDIGVQTTAYKMDWVDVTSAISYMGFGLLNDNRSYYQVQDVTFQPGQEIKTRWTYTPEDSEQVGKWHILGYDSQTGLINSIVQDAYIYVDPWWEFAWSKKRDINFTSGQSIINLTYIADMNADFSDIRFLDYATELVERGYWIQTFTSSQNAIVHLASNITQKLYYGNSGATTTSNIQNVYPGIQHYYPFDGSGTDGVGTANISTLGGTWVAGSIFGAYQFTGSEHPALPFLLGDIDGANNDFSVTFRLYRTGNMGEGKCISNGGTTGISANGQWEIYCYGTSIGSYLYGSALRDTGTSWVSQDAWHLVVYTYDGTTGTLYLNGVQVGAQTDASFNASSTANTLFIGGRDTDENIENARMDDLRFYNHSLSSAEISAITNQFLNNAYTLGSVETMIGVSNTLVSPANNTLSTNLNVNFTVNSSVQAVNLSNVTLSVWNATDNSLVYQNVTTLTGTETVASTWSVNLEEGNFLWGATTRGFEGVNNYEYISSNRTLTVDVTPPQITLNAPTQNQTFITLTVPYNVTLNATTSDPHLSTCFYSIDGGATNTTYTCNTTTNIEFASEGVKSLLVGANDTLGNRNSTNITFNLYYFSITQAEAQDPISEGLLNTITLVVNLSGFPIPNTFATLTWNGENKGSGSKSLLDANTYRFENNFVIPDGSGSSGGAVVPWNWSFNVTGAVSASTTTPTQNQTVYSVEIDDCSALGTLIINYTLRDENTQSILSLGGATNGTIEVQTNIYSWQNDSIFWTYNTTKTNTNPVRICVNNGLLNGSTSYRLDSVARYYSTDRVTEFDYISYKNLSNNTIPNQVGLYNLEIIDAQSFLIKYQDENYLNVEGAIIELWRKYIGSGEFIPVEDGRTDIQGQTVLSLVPEDVIYKVYVRVNGEIVWVEDEFLAICQTSTCLINIRQQGDVGLLAKGDSFGDLVYTLTPNQTARTLDFEWLTVSGNDADIIFTVTKFDGYGNNTVCSDSQSLSAGTMTCTIPLSAGNSTYQVLIEYDDETLINGFFSLQPKNPFGATGILLEILLYMTLVLIAVPSGAVVTLVGAVLGLIFGGLLYLYTSGSIIGTGSMIVWFVIACIIIIIKIIRSGRHD